MILQVLEQWQQLFDINEGILYHIVFFHQKLMLSTSKCVTVI